MNKRFRCGRLILTRDGVIKKVDLENGGGSRFCTWDHQDMRFSDVHYRLLKIFNLRGRKHETSLYDFELRPLNFKRYATFGEYIYQNGLNGNSTCVYLCTREVDETRTLMTNDRNSCSIKPTSSSTFNPLTFTQSKTNSFRTLTEYRHIVGDEPYSNSALVHPSSFDYSFKTSSNQLMGNIRDLINQNSFNQMLIQVLEYICIIHGYVSSTIEPLVQQIQQSNKYFQSMNQFERTLYTNSLKNVYDICQSTVTLLNRNKNKYDHIQIFLTMTNSFSRFYEHLKILQNKWLGNFEKNDNIFSTTSISSSFTRSSIEALSSEDRPEIKLENSQKSSQVSEPLSSFQESSNDRINKQSSLFQPVLSCLNHLLNLLNLEHLSSFRELVELSIDKIKSVRTSINLNDEQSIRDGKRVILFVKNQFVEKSHQLYHNQWKCNLDRQLNVLLHDSLRVIKFLFTNLYAYQLEAQRNNEQDDSNRLPLSPVLINLGQSEDTRTMELNKRKFKNDDDHC